MESILIVYLTVFSPIIFTSDQEPSTDKYKLGNTNQEQSARISGIDSLALKWEELKIEGNHMKLREEVERYVKRLRRDNGHLPFEAYYYLALSYQTGPFENGLAYCDSALVLSTKNLYLYQKCEVLKGIFLRKKGEYQASIDYLASLAGRINNDSVLFDIHRQLSINFRKKNQYDSAIYYCREAQQIAHKLNNEEYLYYAIQSMANIYSALGEYENSLEKEKELVAIAERTGKPNLILSNMVNLAISYFELKREDSALYYYDRAVKLASKLEDLEHLGLLYTIYASYLIETEDFTKAKEVMTKARDYSEQSGRKDHILRSVYYLGYINMLAEDYDEAIQYAKDGISLARELEVRVDLGSFYELLSEIFEKKADYRSAYEYSEEHRIVMDSVLNVEKVRAISELSAKYETEKKEREIRDLRQQAEIQQLKIRQKNIFIAFGIILSVLLVIAAILFYRQNNLKHQTRLVELEHRFLRSQLNPHFIFNALTAIQKFIVKNNPIDGGRYMSKFSQLMRQVLEHSREEYITFDDEINALKNYLDLQQLRFENKFEYAIDVDPEINTEETRIPPMFAQPFIENALEHGLSQKDGIGKIDISFAKNNGLIRLDITDNGSGIENVDGRKQGHKSLATQITKERMRSLNYKLSGSLNLFVDSKRDKDGKVTGTHVQLTLPCE